MNLAKNLERADELEKLKEARIKLPKRLSHARLVIASKQTVYRQYVKIGRNELCYCGSGKKYKRCCIDKTR